MFIVRKTFALGILFLFGLFININTNAAGDSFVVEKNVSVGRDATIGNNVTIGRDAVIADGAAIPSGVMIPNGGKFP